MIVSMLNKISMDLNGIDYKSIPQDQGICSSQTMEYLQKLKPHTGACVKGRAALVANLMNMDLIRDEIFIRSIELAMCFDSGSRGDAGHPERLKILFSKQKDCAKFIKNAVHGIGKNT